MKELLEKVINGESLYVDLPFTPIKEIEKVLKELGVNTKNVDADTNGWQIDFWYVYENQYQLSGSLHYVDKIEAELFNKIYNNDKK